jgi:hypothetical protein
VDDGNVRDGDALGHGEEDVATSLDSVGDLSAAVPAPAARPGRQRSAGSRVEAMPAQCTARRNISCRMSWHSVSCEARAEQRPTTTTTTITVCIGQP